MGLPRYWYYLMHAAGFALMTAVTVRRCSAKSMEKKRALTYTLFTFLGGLLGAMLMGRIYTAAAHAAGTDEVSYVAIFGAVIFTPFFLLAALGLQRRRDPAVDIPLVLDCVAPGSFLAVICGKFGCFLYGCCWGVAWDRGIFDPLAGERVFPVQLAEVASMLLVLFAVTRLERRPHFIRGGTYPLTAALYAVVRFGWEFLRGYAPRMRRFYLGMSFWQLCCILVFAASVGTLFALRLLRRKQDRK